MYSGDRCIFGVQLTLAQAIEYIKAYAEKSNYQILTDGEEFECARDEFDDWTGIVIELFGNNGLKLLGLPCCLFDKQTVFLGYKVLTNGFVYRDNINSFETFDLYCVFITEEINKAQQKIHTIETECKKTLDNLMDSPNPKYYSFANDCDACT